MALIDVGSLEPQDKQVNDANNPQFDIFENSSPQRPIHTSGSATSAHNGEKTPAVNFSRKRMQIPTVDGAEPSKRPRHAEPLSNPVDLNEKPLPELKASPGRISKFREASMHDRPSDKPPSIFTRVFNTNQQSEGQMDILMEDYSHVNSSSPQPPTKMQTQLKGLTHHPNMSITSSSTMQTTDTNKTKSSSIFRFGRSMAATFNPVNLWNNLAGNWSQAKDELEHEAVDARQKEWDERKVKAEQAYADLKKAGAQGFKTYSQQASQNSNRDSGIEMDDETPRPSSEQLPTIPFPTAPLSLAATGRRPSFHFRTPSLSNLKKRASEVNLHKRSVSVSRSQTAEKEPSLEPNTIHRALSKKDLNRQTKLTKKVSDLETKLEKAKRELQEVMDSAPPVPPIPPKHAQAPGPRSANRPRSAHVKKFEPLPTLPSESLLFADMARQSNVPDIAQQYFDAEAKSEGFDDAHIGTLVEHTNTKYVFGIKDIVKEAPLKTEDENDETAFKTPAPASIEPTSFFDTSSPVPPSSPAKLTKAIPAAAAKKISKRRSEEMSKSYKPGISISDDEAEWREAAKPKKKKKASPPETTSPKDAAAAAKKKKTKENLPPLKQPTFPERRSSRANLELDKGKGKGKGKGNVLTKPAPVQTQQSTRIPSPTNSPTASSPRGHIRHRHQRSLSPIKPQDLNAARGYKQYRQRSVSPPPSRMGEKKGAKQDREGAGKEKTRKALKKKGPVVVARPNGKDVPPLPGSEEWRSPKESAKERGVGVERESWEWPEDVF